MLVEKNTDKSLGTPMRDLLLSCVPRQAGSRWDTGSQSRLAGLSVGLLSRSPGPVALIRRAR